MFDFCNFIQFFPSVLPACFETASALSINLSHTHKKLILLFIILADMKNHVTKYVWDYNFFKSVLRKYFSDVVVNRRITVNAIAIHCTANPRQIFPEIKLHSLVPNFHIHVSVSDLYILRISLHVFLQQNKWTNRGNI